MLLDDDSLGAQLFNSDNVQAAFQVLLNLLGDASTQADSGLKAALRCAFPGIMGLNTPGCLVDAWTTTV